MHCSIAFAGTIAAVCVACMGSTANDAPAPEWVYVGGKDAISLFRLDQGTGVLKPQGVAARIGAGFFAFSPDQRFLYATAKAVGADQTRSGELLAFSVDRASGLLTLLNRQPSQGDDPCFVIVDPTGKHVLVTNYNSATVAVFPANADGSLGPASCVVEQTGSSVDPQRQTRAYAHSVNLDPSGRFAYVADLGTDQLFIYRFDSSKGTLAPADPPFVRLPPGSGPRHFTFDPAGKHAYLINEMGATVAVYLFDPATGALQQQQLVSTLPVHFKGINTSAEVQVDPTGRFLYASNRGDTDNITIFAIDPASGKLALIGYQSTLGKTPRNFRIDPTGRYLIVANQGSNSIVMFSIDQATGKLTLAGKSLTGAGPTCVKFLPATAR